MSEDIKPLAAATSVPPMKMNTIVFSISREQAIMEGHVAPTPEEVEKYNTDSRLLWERWTAEWEQADAYRAALGEVDDTVARIVLDLHRQIDDDTAECYGCPTDSEGDRESWPCVTVKAVSRAVGVEPPKGWLGHRPGPEPHVMPPEGFKPFVLPLRRWITNATAEAFDRHFDTPDKPQ